MTNVTDWTSEIQIHYPLITETALSPDGRQVVVVVREPVLTDTESRFMTHLYLAQVPDPGEAAGELVQLTHGAHSNHHARWSPDGRYLAFLSDRGAEGKANIHAMRVAGGESWALTAYEKTGVTDLAWSRDGAQLAFLMPEPPTEAKLKAREARDDTVLWGEDYDFQHIFIVPFAVSARTAPEAQQVTQGRFHVLSVAWLPDGERLALGYRPTPEEDAWTESRLALAPAASKSGVDDLTDLGAVGAWSPVPVLSPDGAWIACVTGNRPLHWAEASRVVLYPVDGGDPRPLARTPDEQGWIIGWAADSGRVYVGETSGLDTHIWALDVAGASAAPVLATPTYKSAMHTPGNDRIVFVEEMFWRVNEVWVWEGGQARCVAAPGMPEGWPDAPLPEVEVVRWAAPDPLPDGSAVEIEGIVVYPVGYERGTRAPLVVDVHGGPAGVFQRQHLASPNRHCDLLALAARGIAVLRANPRGSGGYGCAFRYANYGDWGGCDFRDIMAGVDTLIERGVADPQRLGIMGWSYGGFMTSWAITRTDRFRAACVGAGVTNLMSFNGTADIPGFVPDYFSAEFWDDLDAYRDHSALFQIQSASTPTLIQHGEVDIRVPLSQGRELYNALKRRGVPVEMVIYPRQGHGISEPRLLIDRRKRPVDWFARWLLELETA